MSSYTPGPGYYAEQYIEKCHAAGKLCSPRGMDDPTFLRSNIYCEGCADLISDSRVSPEAADSRYARKCADCRRFVPDTARAIFNFYKELWSADSPEVQQDDEYYDCGVFSCTDRYCDHINRDGQAWP